MTKEIPGNSHNPPPPSLDEILAAASPGASEEARKDIRERLRSCTPTDDAVAGARQFLEDTGYDFDALYRFTAAKPLSTKKSQGIAWQRIAVAASLMVFMLMGWQYLQNMKRHQRMTDMVFYEPGLPVFASMGGDRDFHEMMTAFKMKDAQAGLKYLKMLQTRFAIKDTLAYYGGWLYYMRHDYDSAAKYFSAVAQDTTATYQQKAELMAAAALMLGDRKEEAEALLKKLQSDGETPYKKEAENISGF